MMDTEQVGQHISQQFNADLEQIRENVLAMGGLVEEQMNRALESFIDHNAEAAAEVIGRDEKVNEFEMEIDDQCTKILAKRQPAAGDLRLIVTVLKTITDLERIGDEAEKIARLGHTISEKRSTVLNGKLHYGALEHLGGHVRKMLRGALDAFARMDVKTAIKICKLDVKADKEYDAISRQLMTYMMEEPRSISEVLDMLWTARALERIGDHANNICEYVVYMVQGEDVRHLSWDEIKRRAKKNK